jgi:perosamine synthetase
MTIMDSDLELHPFAKARRSIRKIFGGAKIRIEPVLDFKRLLAKPNASLPPPLNRRDVEFYPYGRVALLQGLRLLPIRAGDNVLVPSVICSSVLAPFNASGIKVRYYDIDDHLKPKFDTAREMLDSRTRAFLGVHYFGFPQNVDEIKGFCERYGLQYIEDNSHGFLSAMGSRPLGTFGEVAIFSQRKTQALPHGGALLLNSNELVTRSQADIVPLELNRRSPVVRFLLRNLGLNMGAYIALDMDSILGKFPSHFSAVGGGEEDDLTNYLESYSQLSNWILYRMDTRHEVEVRRRGFEHWQELMSVVSKRGFSPVFDDLPEGVVPWVFPLRVVKRKEFISELSRFGIQCVGWPPLPSKAPRTRISEELTLLPLLQTHRTVAQR